MVIEKVKKGSIMVFEYADEKRILIAKSDIYESYRDKEPVIDYYYMIMGNGNGASNCSLLVKGSSHREATMEEKISFLKAMEKLGKQWKGEKLQIVPINAYFKRGAFIAGDGWIAISAGKTDEKHTEVMASYCKEDQSLETSSLDVLTNAYRYATHKEKKTMLEMLKKNGKVWNEYKLRIENKKLKEKWKPKKGEKYFYPNLYSNEGQFIVYIAEWTNHRFDKDLFDNWHIFKTKEECDACCEKLNRSISGIK